MPRRLGLLLLPAATALLAIAAVPASAATARTLDVPGFPTIQAAIDAAADGDTVVVAPGTYRENIDFKGRAITVVSAQGPASTVIDGGGRARVVTFAHGEGPRSVLQGFTIRNGSSTSGDHGYGGAGIQVWSASPVVRGNVIVDNVACGDGAGIEVSFGSPAILQNVIAGNSAPGCSGGGGGGIAIGGAASAQVIGNVITRNRNYWGGGISLFAAGTPTISDNVISENSAASEGAGMWIVNRSDALIAQNLITGNRTSSDGGGVYFLTPSGARGPLLVNNTIADNTGAHGSAVWVGGFSGGAQLFNNVLQSRSGQGAIDCDTTYDPSVPVLDHNDAFAGGGTAFADGCAGQAGVNGNISADPRFAGPGDYHLQPGSPAIDAGNSAAPQLPATDLDGRARIAGAAVDQGAYEAQQPG